MRVESEVEIGASPAAVWDALTDFDRYEEWNPLITEISGRLAEQAVLRLTVSPPGSGPLELKSRVLRVEPERELRWRTRTLFEGVLDTERYFKLAAIAGGRTRLTHGESYRGFLLRFIRGRLAQSSSGQKVVNGALKRWVETHV